MLVIEKRDAVDFVVDDKVRLTRRVLDTADNLP